MSRADRRSPQPGADRPGQPPRHEEVRDRRPGPGEAAASSAALNTPDLRQPRRHEDIRRQPAKRGD